MRQQKNLKGLYSKHKKPKKTSPSKESFTTYLEQNARYWCMSNEIIIYPHPKRDGKVINITMEIKIRGKSTFSPKTYTNSEYSEACCRIYLHLFNKYGAQFFDNSVNTRYLRTSDLNK